MKTPSSRLSLKSDNAVCKSASFNDKHQAIEEPDEEKFSRPVLKERAGKRFLARLKPEIQIVTAHRNCVAVLQIRPIGRLSQVAFDKSGSKRNFCFVSQVAVE